MQKRNVVLILISVIIAGFLQLTQALPALAGGTNCRKETITTPEPHQDGSGITTTIQKVVTVCDKTPTGTRKRSAPVKCRAESRAPSGVDVRRRLNPERYENRRTSIHLDLVPDDGELQRDCENSTRDGCVWRAGDVLDYSLSLQMPPLNGRKYLYALDYTLVCPGGVIKGHDFKNIYESPGLVKPPYIRQLETAQEISATMKLPTPNFGFYRILSKSGKPYTYVNADNYFGVDRALFQQQNKKVEVDGVWVTVTATPVGLTFTPGDGKAAKWCRGPGSATTDVDVWLKQIYSYKPDPSGCSYRYTRVTKVSRGNPNDMLTAQLAINWALRWDTNNGAGGELPPMTTSAQATFGVGELHTLVVG